MRYFLILKYRPVMIFLFIFIISCIPREDKELQTVLIQIQTLPEILSENSGMAEDGTIIWFINDSGNEPELYGYDKSSNEVVKTVVVTGAFNTDWEDITQNSSNFFIGDFGNNGGSRTDLKIYIVSKQLLHESTTSVLPTGIINFSYEDQTDFTYDEENTPYDCEAFIATDDSVYLFTKDWVSNKTSIYSLPVQAGTYQAKYRTQIDIGGLITSAAWESTNGGFLLLLGYMPAYPFIWTFEGFDPDNLSYANAGRVDFTNYYATQTEGLLISSDGSIYVSSEAISTLNKPAQLFRISSEY